MYQIEFTPEAFDDLAAFRPFDQRRIVSAIETDLVHEPSRPTRHRKPLRPNSLAHWELRIDIFRVFYDIMEATQVVRIVALGRKTGNDLYIRGERFEL